MRRTLPVLLMLLSLTACGLLGGQGAGKTNPVEAVFKDPLTTAQIKPTLLTIKDLPTGWKVDTEADDDESGDESEDTKGSTPECTRLWDSLDLDNRSSKSQAVGEASIDFTGGDFGPFLAEEVSSYKGSTIKDQIAGFEVALKKCQTFTEPQNDGSTMTYKMSPLAFPNLGDQTVAGKMSGNEPTLGIPFAADFVLVRVDQNLVALVSAGIGEARMDAKEFEKVVRTAVERVQAAS